MFYLMTVVLCVAQVWAQDAEFRPVRMSAGIEFRQASSGWVNPRPIMSVDKGWIGNHAVADAELSILMPWAETAPGTRVGHAAGRLALLVGWMPAEPALSMEVLIGPSVSVYTSRWTAPIEHVGFAISPGVRTRLTMGPQNRRIRVSMGGCWRTDGMDLSLQVGR